MSENIETTSITNLKGYSLRVLNALNKLYQFKDNTVKNVITEISSLSNSYEHRIVLTKGDNKTEAYDSTSSKISINFKLVDEAYKEVDFKKTGLTDTQLLGHELKHSYDYNFNIDVNDKDPITGIETNEINAVSFENLIRKEEGKKLRSAYGGITVF